MTRPMRAAALGLIGVLGACAGGVAAGGCLGDVACATASAASAHAAISGLVVAAFATLLLILLRASWLLAAAGRAITALDRVAAPPGLQAAIHRTGLSPALVTAVRDDGALAFCSGLARPRIVVTDTLAARLRPEELDATLVHEAAHARRRDPLRHALRHAAAEVLFYVPLAAWWARRQVAAAELAADRTAMARISPAALAGALWAAADGPDAGGHAPIAGLRAGQVLGDGVPRLRPSAADLAGSVAGLGAAVVVGLCLSQLVGR